MAPLAEGSIYATGSHSTYVDFFFSGLSKNVIEIPLAKAEHRIPQFLAACDLFTDDEPFTSRNSNMGEFLKTLTVENGGLKMSSKKLVVTTGLAPGANGRVMCVFSNRILGDVKFKAGNDSYDFNYSDDALNRHQFHSTITVDDKSGDVEYRAVLDVSPTYEFDRLHLDFHSQCRNVMRSSYRCTMVEITPEGVEEDISSIITNHISSSPRYHFCQFDNPEERNFKNKHTYVLTCSDMFHNWTEPNKAGEHPVALSGGLYFNSKNSNDGLVSYYGMIASQDLQPFKYEKDSTSDSSMAGIVSAAAVCAASLVALCVSIF